MNTTAINYKDVFQLAESKGYRIRNKAILMVSDDYWIEWQKIGQLSESDFLELCIIQKWLRDTHKIHIEINTEDFIYYGTCLNKLDNPENSGYWTYSHNSYEDSLLYSINEALQLI